MFIRRLSTMNYCLLLILMITVTALTAQDNVTEEEIPQTQPKKSEFLFEPVEFLPIFKKVPLPAKPKISEDELKESIMRVYSTLKESWLKNRMYNELFELMKTRKNKLYKTFIDDYFNTSSSFDWKVVDFEVLIKQYGLKDGRTKVEELLTTKFDYDDEFLLRLHYLFLYQKTFTKDYKTEVIAFINKLQKQLKKPEISEESPYYWMSMLALAAGDDSKLGEVQDWLYNVHLSNNSDQLLSSENFRNIIIKANARNLTERFVDSTSWEFVYERALEENVIPTIDAIFAEALSDKEFQEKSFNDKFESLNPNLQPYYALISLLNGVKGSFEKVVELIDRLGRLSLYVNLIKPNKFNRKFAPKFLEIMVSKLKSNSYSTRYAAKEAVRRLLLFSEDFKSDKLIDIYKKVENADLQVSELKEMKTILMFLAASIKDEVNFEKIFVELMENTTPQQFLSNIRNQFYRSAEYFNDNLKLILGKRILSIITPDLPFSEYVVFEVLKEFADEKEIAETILGKIPEWYTKGREDSRRFFFSHSGTKNTLLKIAELLPEKSAKLVVPMFAYIVTHERMYDSTRITLQEVLAICGIKSAGYLQQMYEVTKDVQYVYLISGLKTKDVAGFVYEEMSKLTSKSEAVIKVLENLRNLLDSESYTLILPFMLNEDLSQTTRLSCFVTMMYLITD